MKSFLRALLLLLSLLFHQLTPTTTFALSPPTSSSPSLPPTSTSTLSSTSSPSLPPITTTTTTTTPPQQRSLLLYGCGTLGTSLLHSLLSLPIHPYTSITCVTKTTQGIHRIISSLASSNLIKTDYNADDERSNGGIVELIDVTPTGEDNLRGYAITLSSSVKLTLLLAEFLPVNQMYDDVTYMLPPSAHPAEKSDSSCMGMLKLRNWKREGTFLYTSSTAVYTAGTSELEEIVYNEFTVLPKHSTVGLTARINKLLRAESECLNHAGGEDVYQNGCCVVRLSGLYNLLRGPHNVWLRPDNPRGPLGNTKMFNRNKTAEANADDEKAKDKDIGIIVEEGNELINMVSYGDAGWGVLGLLLHRIGADSRMQDENESSSKDSSEDNIYLISDNVPITRQTLCELAFKSNKFRDAALEEEVEADKEEKRKVFDVISPTTATTTTNPSIATNKKTSTRKTTSTILTLPKFQHSQTPHSRRYDSTYTWSIVNKGLSSLNEKKSTGGKAWNGVRSFAVFMGAVSDGDGDGDGE